MTRQNILFSVILDRHIPIKTLLQSFTLGGTAAAHTPWSLLLSTGKSELLADRLWWQRTWYVLLVAEDEKRYTGKLLLGEHGEQFGARRV